MITSSSYNLPTFSQSGTVTGRQVTLETSIITGAQLHSAILPVPVGIRTMLLTFLSLGLAK